MADIPFLRIVTSKGSEVQGDCGICSVATLTCNTYEDVVAQAVVLGCNWKNGLYSKEIIKLAAHFGMTLKRKRKFSIEEDTGILEVDVKDPGSKKKQPHAVVINGGRIYDWDGTSWAPDAYIQFYQAKVGCLLMLVD